MVLIRVWAKAPAARTNVLGVVAKVGVETGKKSYRCAAPAGVDDSHRGKAVHLSRSPGGVAKRHEETPGPVKQVAGEAVDFARVHAGPVDKVVLKNSDYVNLILSDTYTHRTNYMGMVDDQNRLNFYDGKLRVVSPEGNEVLKFPNRQYLDHIAEHVEPWSYMKFTYLKSIGWKGFTEGAESGIYSVAPLARLNASDALPTPLAQEAAKQYFSTLGGKPVHHTLALHWARLIEMLCAAERMKELAEDPEITDSNIRTVPTATPKEGVASGSAARIPDPSLSDDRRIDSQANLIVATQSQRARMANEREKAARPRFRNEISDGVLTCRDGVPGV